MKRTLIVGSSPQLLLEGIAYAERGDAVVVVEGRDRLGGAWSVVEFAHHRRVEAACHLIERDSVGYRALVSQGVPLQPLDPQPRTVIRPGLSVRYGGPSASFVQLAYHPVSRVARPTQLDRNGWRRRLQLETRELADAIADRGPVLGVRGGAARLIDALVERALDLGVEIRDETRVDQVHDRGGEASVSYGERSAEESYDEVVLSAAFDPERLHVDGSPVGGAVRRRSFSHRLFAFPVGTVRPHSYLRFLHDPVLLRCADVTESASPEGHEVFDLLLVSVRCDDTGVPRSSSVETLDRLARHSVVPKGVQAVDETWQRYEGRDGFDALAAGLPERSPVRVVRSYGDLSRAVAASAARCWNAPTSLVK